MSYRASYPSQASSIAPTQGSILQIPTAEIYTNTTKTAQRGGKTLRLIQDVKKYGVSAPIIVAPTEVFPGVFRYLVLEGEETWHAACLAGLTQIPCLITQNTPQEAEIARIFAKIGENTTDMFEQAVLFRHLTDTYGFTQEEISRRVGISQSAVANKLRLLHLTAAEQREILLHGLSERHARALLRLKSPESRLSVLATVCRKNLSVSATEALVEGYLPPAATSFASAEPANALIGASNVAQGLKLTDTESPVLTQGRGKFVLHTLQPLYNSLERTLNIFRKTGRTAVLESVQTENGLTITITIPNP